MKFIQNAFITSLFALLCVIYLGNSPIAHADSFNPYCNNGIDDSTPGGTGDSPGEHCEDYNATDTDDCKSDCQLASCGDGVLHLTSSNTTLDDGIPDLMIFKGELGFLEGCDDGNAIPGDGCSDTCVVEANCGNDALDPGEGCDDGNNVDGDGCSSLCTVEDTCGDGAVDLGESCDDGKQCEFGTPCSDDADCTGEGDELCLTRDGDGCSSLCHAEYCGDGIVAPWEDCDDGNFDNTDDCKNDCSANICGDGILNINGSVPETCDDGDQITDGTGCTSDCSTLEIAAGCGNGTAEGSEECDDGGNDDGDGCSATCTIERCGDGTVQAGEECDDGNNLNGDDCSATCSVEGCGNGRLDLGEECDNGRQCDDGTNCTVDDDCTGIGDEMCLTRDGDGCDATCIFEAGYCGNGLLEEGEECDDGNQNSQDLCKNNCTKNTEAIEAGAICGNGTIEAPESCDDGNIIDGDGCSNSCVDEVPGVICGNGVLELGETCDDGDALDTGVCNATCTGEGSDAAGAGDGAGDGANGDQGGGSDTSSGCSLSPSYIFQTFPALSQIFGVLTGLGLMFWVRRKKI